MRPSATTLDLDTKHLTALVTALIRRVEKLEGHVAQLRAEGNHQTLTYPTRREFDQLDIRLERIEEQLP